jgi:hypothetical protein
VIESSCKPRFLDKLSSDGGLQDGESTDVTVSMEKRDELRFLRAGDPKERSESILRFIPLNLSYQMMQ